MLLMELSKTVVCKIIPSEKDAQRLLTTLETFRDASNYISKLAFEYKVFNPITLHNIVYQKMKQKFKFSANLAIRVRNRVVKAYEQKRDKPIRFKTLSINLDKRLFRLTYKPDGIYASISALQGRVTVMLDIGDYQKKLLENINPARAVLVYRNKTFFLHIIIKKQVPEPKGKNPIGVDIGMKNLLVASNGFKIKGGKIIAKRHHLRELRSSLKAKGTASAKRKLKRLGRRERRYVNTILHQVSRAFVNSLREGDIVVMENLIGIRNNTKYGRSLHSWAFRRLQFFIEYKALEKGIPVVYVEPTNTSLTCPRCGYISKRNRRTQSLFRCIKCRFQHNADFVASLNLSRVELARSGRARVNEPNAGMSGFNHYDSPASPHDF